MIVSPKEVVKDKIIYPIESGEIQIQPSGIDLRLKQVFSFDSSALLDFDNSERITPNLIPLEFENEIVHLKPGSYVIECVERINVPLNMTAFLHARSSLIRSGILFDTGLYDAGYAGKIGATIYVGNPHGVKLKRNARVCQCVCFLMNRETHSGYKGMYQCVSEEPLPLVE